MQVVRHPDCIHQRRLRAAAHRGTPLVVSKTCRYCRLHTSVCDLIDAELSELLCVRTFTASLPVTMPRDRTTSTWRGTQHMARWRRIWGYWVSPLQYSQNAISINEFTAPRWQTPYSENPSVTLGHEILSNRGLFTCALSAQSSHHPAGIPATTTATARRPCVATCSHVSGSLQRGVLSYPTDRANSTRV